MLSMKEIVAKANEYCNEKYSGLMIDKLVIDTLGYIGFSAVPDRSGKWLDCPGFGVDKETGSIIENYNFFIAVEGSDVEKTYLSISEFL